DEMRGLLDLAGRAATLEILLEGRVFGADEAQVKGLLTRVVDADALETELAATTARLCAGAPLAARLNKWTAARLACDPSPLGDDEWRACFAYADGADHRRGVQAFLQGTDPVFTGEGLGTRGECESLYRAAERLSVRPGRRGDRNPGAHLQLGGYRRHQRTHGRAAALIWRAGGVARRRPGREVTRSPDAVPGDPARRPGLSAAEHCLSRGQIGRAS